MITHMKVKRIRACVSAGIKSIGHFDHQTNFPVSDRHVIYVTSQIRHRCGKCRNHASAFVQFSLSSFNVSMTCNDGPRNFVCVNFLSSGRFQLAYLVHGLGERELG